VNAAGEELLTSGARDGRLAHVELERDDRVAVLPLAESGACVFYRASWDPTSGGFAAAAHPANPGHAGAPGRAGAGSEPSADAAEPIVEGRCVLHHALGHEALPLACRQFPRVSLTDPRGTFVTLSHFCPTAAAQLFRHDVPLDVVENAAAFPPGAEYVGLDARDALPPLLRPGMLCDLDGFAVWEASGVRLFADDARSPEEALDELAYATERIRDWRPADGSLTGRVRGAFAAADDGQADEITNRNGPERHLGLVNGCLPDGLGPRTLVADHSEIDACLVAPEWAAFAPALRRYLATRLFGSWLAYQGRGLRTIVRSLAVSLSILRLECGRACAAAGRRLDRELLTQALRQTDRLMVHEMDGLSFARRLSAVESASPFEHAW
jgi:hypothetical protein